MNTLTFQLTTRGAKQLELNNFLFQFNYELKGNLSIFKRLVFYARTIITKLCD